MQFGLFTLFDFIPQRQNEIAYYRDTLDLMIYAEKLGFDSVWVGEEHFYSFGICPSPQLFLTALARETTRLRLGTAVSLLVFDNPLRKAEDFAMLDILSDGRLNFGVARGLIPKHFQGFGVAPQESRARYEEALEIIRQAWTQERFSYEGQFWRVPELSVSPKPLQKPHPPIYRGTISPEAFETAGIKGDGAFVIPWLTAPMPEMVKRVNDYRALLKEHGHTKVPPPCCIFFLFIDEDYRTALADGQESTRRYVHNISAFTPTKAIAQLIPGDPLKQFLELVMSLPDELEARAVVGTPRDCRRRLAELRDQFNMEHVAFYLHAGARDITRARKGLELFAKEVMPEFC
jgi:alkanesulfonate monooxygenase SsuD/methylene tetrahydromethanopterin reductase-like flavin-dependent oxidoreductase (luciferase family)